MKTPTCLCGMCRRCCNRVDKRNSELRKKMAAEQQKPTNVPVKKRLPEKQRGRRVPSHNQALRFDARKRPFDPLAAAEHISAIFTECPGADKPHLLARIKGIVADVDPMWGGFRFPPIFQEPVQNGISTIAADPEHVNPLPEQK